MTMRHCVASILFLFRHASIEHNGSSSFGRRGLLSSSSEAKTKVVERSCTTAFSLTRAFHLARLRLCTQVWHNQVSSFPPSSPP